MTTPSGSRSEPHLEGSDSRPEFRVALFGVAEKFQRTLEIVTRHAVHNPYNFRLAENRSASNFDIALVDMTVSGGPEVAGTLQKLLNGRPVIQLGRRHDESRGPDELTHQQFASQVIEALKSRYCPIHCNHRVSLNSTQRRSPLDAVRAHWLLMTAPRSDAS